ncbi:MAG: tRNA modification GTPase MnmE [Candidatus Anoxychlamydiales bacterium]|nr:tRNA modification GTPase MnmE [Candidatus Anoxychlamydiales bacterium]NGX35713.1 tRNA modification GTPase MnmE [Candidatus Anoxychlamydiales bacterium]
MIQRTNIGIFGKVNAGKSTLMNLITQQVTSIVDSTYGTTTDIKVSLMEIHTLGPIKLFDTAGIDEKTELGLKKRQKTIACLKQSDLILLVIDPNDSFDENLEIIDLCKKYEKSCLLIYNNFRNKKNQKISKDLSIPKIHLDLSDKNAKDELINFILKNFSPSKKENLLFPFLKKDDIVFLNIPMDEETPEKRLLKPQSFVQEYLIRRFIATFAYRMDLKKARSKDKDVQKQEFLRFKKFLNIFTLKTKNNLKLLITDSQAMDIIHPWTLDDKGQPLVEITTFSVIMAHQKGDLSFFIKGTEAFDKLKKNDKVLIAEACNHNRIKEDIGTFQIPNKINNHFGKNNIKIDHAFGRDFASYNLSDYKLIIHCGGCMLDKQQMQSRLTDLKNSDIPITNYGLILSYFQSKKAFKRVLKPFNYQT